MKVSRKKVKKDDISYPKRRESHHGDETDPVFGDRGDGTEYEKGESDKGDGTNPDKGESDKKDKIYSKLPKYKVGTLLSGVHGSYTGVVLTRHHSSILCILLN